MNVAQALPLADTWGMHGDVGAGWMILMMAVMVLFWAAIVLGIVWLVRGATGGWAGPRSESATEVLQRRFAEGEISADEYRTRREVLLDGATQAEDDEPALATAAQTRGG
jgi:putative membrane protein